MFNRSYDKKRQKFVQKIGNYAAGGLLAAGVDLLVLYICAEYRGIQYLWSQGIAFIISFTVGFLFQKYITFAQRGGDITMQGLLFLVFQFIGLGANLVILFVCVELFGIHYLLGSVIAKGIVFIRNFIMNHYFNFKPQNP